MEANTVANTDILESQALNSMCSGLLKQADINAICKARGLPRGASQQPEVFRHYLVSGEGLDKVWPTLDEKELILLHLLYMNQIAADISYFKAAYVPLPKERQWYYRETFTQEFKDVFKTVRMNLVRKGVLFFYQTEANYGTQLERWRFLVPRVVGEQTPPPFKSMKNDGMTGDQSDAEIKRVILHLVNRERSGGRNPSKLRLSQNAKILFGQDTLSENHLTQLQLELWELNGSLLMTKSYKEAGLSLSGFLLKLIDKLPDDEYFAPKVIEPILNIWSYDWELEKRLSRSGGDSNLLKNYQSGKICHAGWECGLLEKLQKGTEVFYKKIAASKETPDPSKFFSIKENDQVQIDLPNLPLAWTPVVNSTAVWEKQNEAIYIRPDLINLGKIPAEYRKHPLIVWLKTHTKSFGEAFETYRKAFGKQIVHQNLLVAKISDLPLKVALEKELKKRGDFVSLSNEFIAFPKSLLPLVERIVLKSGNVVKRF